MTPTSSSEMDRAAVRVGCHALALCLEQLRQGSPTSRALRLELSRTASQAPGYAYLRLSTYDQRGWWEYNGLAVETEAETVEQRTIVVSLPELTYVVRDAMATAKQFAATITWTDTLEIAGQQLNTLPEDKAPAMPVTRSHIQELALPYPVEPCAISTPLGCLCIDPDLAVHLATRNTVSADLVMVDDAPMLVARAAVAREATAAPITLAPLRRLAPGEEPPQFEPSIPPERRALAADPLHLWLLALDANTHAEVILELLNSSTATVRHRAALHPALSDEILDELLRARPEDTRAAVVLNPNLSEATSRLAALDPSPAVRAALASNPKIATELLSDLASDVNPWVRAEVAANRATPPPILEALARDDDVTVRAAAAENPRTDRAVLRAMSTDQDPRICAALACNPACPPKVLRGLLEIVPHPVLANPSTPRSVITAGARASDPELRAQVARNPSTRPSILDMLADDPDLDVVHAVAYQSAAPKRARKKARNRLDAIDETRAALGLGTNDSNTFRDGPARSDLFAVSTATVEYHEMHTAHVAPIHDDTESPNQEARHEYGYIVDPVADELIDEPTTFEVGDQDPEPLLVDWRSEPPEPTLVPEYVDPFALLSEASELDTNTIVFGWRSADESRDREDELDVTQTKARGEQDLTSAAATDASEPQGRDRRDEPRASEPGSPVAGDAQTLPSPYNETDAGEEHDVEEAHLDDEDHSQDQAMAGPPPPASSPGEILTETLDAIDEALAILRRVLQLDNRAAHRHSRSETEPGRDSADDIATLTARLQAIADHPPASNTHARAGVDQHDPEPQPRADDDTSHASTETGESEQPVTTTGR